MKKEIRNNILFRYIAEEISEGNSVLLSVKGTSMLPFLHEGDVLTLVPFYGSELKFGDIVLFKNKRKKILHRIIKKNNNKLVIQGDAFWKIKEKVTTDDVIARLQKIKRKNGVVVDCTTFNWRISFFIWFLLRPIRPVLMFLYRKLFSV
jgi:signal peptidase I